MQRIRHLLKLYVLRGPGSFFCKLWLKFPKNTEAEMWMKYEDKDRMSFVGLEVQLIDAEKLAFGEKVQLGTSRPSFPTRFKNLALIFFVSVAL
ncbi:hypothetical protein GOP47_0018809 [Adiantum capillus-veneris]|uniref:Uncharacterized protein n=1 Tax=Adiantum capillus-veneris TaxID=13818 RepID=A0A9D4UE34_ADICA|nr:hypothetical protein GOP47_0018809 [Adiantum capillus-veneris]